MQPNQFEHSPPQTTITRHGWLETKKVGRDDAEIKRTRLLVEAERKSKRKRYKPSAHATSGVDAVVNTEISELTQPLELDAELSGTSEDKSLDGRLISPQENRQKHSRKVDNISDGETKITTPTKPDRIENNNSLVVSELRKHIIHQNNVIDELNRKLYIISEVANTARYIRTKIVDEHMKVDGFKELNVSDGGVEDSSVTSSSTKNVINLTFN